MSTGSSENQPTTRTTSNERQPEPLVAPAPGSAPPPRLYPSVPPPADGPYQGSNAQAQHWQQQQPSTLSPYGPQYPARHQFATTQPIQQQPPQASDKYCCCDTKCAVKVFATILMCLFLLSAFEGYYQFSSGSSSSDSYYVTQGKISCALFSVLTLIVLLDLVNAYCVQNSCWYLASSIVWGTCAGVCVGILVAFTILVLTYMDSSTQGTLLPLVVFCLLCDIALLIAYTVALCKASKVAKQTQRMLMPSQPQYAPLPQSAQPQYANHPQQYRV